LSGILAIAHRGARRERPENTLAAFDEALRQRCDGIEMDLQLSGDGVPVIYHDRTLAKAGGGRRKVSQLKLRELRRLDVDGERIPTLEMVLRRYAGRTQLLLELKGRGEDSHNIELVRATVKAIRKARAGAGVLLLSFDTVILDEAERIAPKLPRVLNVKPTPRLRGALRERLRSLFALAVDIRYLTPPFAGAVLRAGCPLLAFTCNRRGPVEQALAAGASGIISDRPGWLREYLA
jgi:glycerophosphoryl diester phosphodiesterase